MMITPIGMAIGSILVVSYFIIYILKIIVKGTKTRSIYFLLIFLFMEGNLVSQSLEIVCIFKSYYIDHNPIDFGDFYNYQFFIAIGALAGFLGVIYTVIGIFKTLFKEGS